MAAPTPAVLDPAPAPANGAAKRVIPLPVIRPEADRAAEALRAEVAEGMLYAHYRANANTSRTLESAAFSYALIELLAERGVITIAELDERKRIVAERLEAKYREQGMGVMRQEAEADKYAFGGGPEIDCASRLHLCKAACCRLNFALSKQDVEEGVVQWEFGRPYMIRHGADGYCAHLDREGCRCGVYQHRPYPCRAYDCRGDERIWADFEARIPSDHLARLLAGRGDRPEGEPAARA
jgi:Fe-S-cluster containining protein